MELAIHYFGAKVSQLYAIEQHGSQTKAASLNMIEDLRSAFDELLQEAEWMDLETKKLAREKLKLIHPVDGYDHKLSPENIRNVYNGLSGITKDSFLNNIVTLKKFWTAKEVLRMIAKPTFKGDMEALGFDTSLVSF